MIEVKQLQSFNLSMDLPIKITNFSLIFPLFNTDKMGC